MTSNNGFDLDKDLERLPPFTIEDGLRFTKQFAEEEGMSQYAYLAATRMVVRELRRLRPDLDASLFRVIDQGHLELIMSVMFGHEHHMFKKARRSGRPKDPVRELHAATCVAAVELLRDADVDGPERKVEKLAVQLPGMDEFGVKQLANWARRMRSEMPVADELRLTLLACSRVRISRGIDAETVVAELFDRSSQHYLGGDDFFDKAVMIGLRHAFEKRWHSKNP